MIDPATTALITLSLASGGAFIYYGYRTLFTFPLLEEYERYGLPRMRTFVGRVQLLGAFGVLLGLVFSPLGLAAALGLCVMMLLGLQVRVRLGDNPRLMLPAASLAVTNGAVAALHVSAMT